MHVLQLHRESTNSVDPEDPYKTLFNIHKAYDFIIVSHLLKEVSSFQGGGVLLHILHLYRLSLSLWSQPIACVCAAMETNLLILSLVSVLITGIKSQAEIFKSYKIRPQTKKGSDYKFSLHSLPCMYTLV